MLCNVDVLECAKFGFQNIMRNIMWNIMRNTGRRLCASEVNERAQQVVNQSLKTDALYEMLEQDGWTVGFSRLSHVEIC